MHSYFKAMRLERWPRSLVIFVGSTAFFFLHPQAIQDINPIALFLKGLSAFFLTWGISTSNYIINEIADAPFDIHHPTKRNRPLVRGALNLNLFIFLGIILTLACLTAAFLLFNVYFFISILTLLIAGFLYNVRPIRTKDIPFLDSVSESANNPIRFFIGWFTFSPSNLLPPLSIIIAWWAFGNFLMVAKRLSEFRFLKETAGKYRASLKRYSKRSLLAGMVISSAVFFTAYFLFAFQFKLESFFILSLPVFIFFVLIFRKTLQEKEVMEEPERLLRHKKFFLYTVFLLLCFLAAFLLDRVGN